MFSFRVAMLQLEVPDTKDHDEYGATHYRNIFH
jgi:hypothetical protein